MPKEFDDMRSAIKKQIKKSEPNLSDEEADKKSWSIAVAQWKKAHGGKSPMEEKEPEIKETIDEDGSIIIGENVKLILNANIASVGDIIIE